MKLPSLAIFVILVSVMLSGCSRPGSAQPPPSTQKLPLYSNAQGLQVQTVNGVKGIPAEETTFTTGDSFENVKAFYQQVLTNDGWSEANYQLQPNGLHFYWVEGCPVYGLDLVLEANDKGQTVVKLKLQKELCM